MSDQHSCDDGRKHVFVPVIHQRQPQPPSNVSGSTVHLCIFVVLVTRTNNVVMVDGFGRGLQVGRDCSGSH